METAFQRVVGTDPVEQAFIKTFIRPKKKQVNRTMLVNFQTTAPHKSADKQSRHIDSSLCRPSIQPQTPISPNDPVGPILEHMRSLRMPMAIRRNQADNVKAVTKILNSPIVSKSSIVRQIKCFMSHSSLHQSYLVSKQLTRRIKNFLKQSDQEETFSFRYEQIGIFIKRLEEKKCEQSLQAYNRVLSSHIYPLSVQLMIFYMGVHLYSIQGQYCRAEELCQRMFDLMIQRKANQCIPIYFILMVKLKANQGAWKEGLQYISRALSCSWAHKLQDLEIWCYFQFSRAHFGLGNHEECEFFKERSQMNIKEGRGSMFREIMEQTYLKEIQMVRVDNYNFSRDFVITQMQLSKNPPRERTSTHLKAQVYAKTITDNFKIKHVKNLIGRMGQEFTRPSYGCLPMAGNPQFLTHESGIKNLNMYFRDGGEERQFYTFQNSFKNVLILKEMVRCILLEMKWFVPILQH